ncbi:hypothetical protein [Fimbriiglobus ruber]|uniref:hypothetical protein n=1 Tax=Fimbriiglobus ruber TaxID=1908690 RepID=UPI00117A2EFF|nr:hypothetical protein [Fimbriiglobus ruber]
MDDLMDKPFRDGTTPLGVLDLVAQLHSEMVALRGEVARLRAENLDLRQQVGYWNVMHAAATERMDVLRQELDHVRGENRQLEADLFGRRSEKPSTLGRSNDLEDRSPDRPPRRRGPQPQRPGPNAGITRTCRSARSGSNSWRIDAAVRVVPNPGPRAGARIPNRSKSGPMFIGG